MHPKTFCLPIVAVCAGLCCAQKLEVALVTESLLKGRLESGLVHAKERQTAIRYMFTDAGCAVEEQKVDKNSANVICKLPGETDSTIVIGGHYDFVDSGKGIVDDWSGVSLLPSLYEALKGRPRRHTYVFVAFAAEEVGLVGSHRYVNSLSKEQRAQIRAFVNLECLGTNPTKVWVSRSTRALVERLDEVAKAIQTDLQGVNVERVGDDDTHHFLSARIPAISIHSITQQTYPILHTSADRLDAIHFNDYYTSYRLVSHYLAYLDLKLE